jgi:hypothetical protein
MAVSYVVAVFKLTNMDAATAKKKYIPEAGYGQPGSHRACNGIAKLAETIGGGSRAGMLVQANAATDSVTFTYGGTTVVLVEATDFLRGASNTTCGDALAAAINAHRILKTIVSAAAVTGTVTITLKLPTTLGHGIVMSTSDATAFTLTQIASGTVGAAQFFLQGFQTGKTL